MIAFLDNPSFMMSNVRCWSGFFSDKNFINISLIELAHNNTPYKLISNILLLIKKGIKFTFPDSAFKFLLQMDKNLDTHVNIRYI
jgi:hypothetical protein